MTVVSYQSDVMIGRLRDLQYRLRARIDVLTDERDQTRDECESLRIKAEERDHWYWVAQRALSRGDELQKRCGQTVRQRETLRTSRNRWKANAETTKALLRQARALHATERRGLAAQNRELRKQLRKAA